MTFGAYVWKREGRSWVLQPNRSIDHAAASFGISQATVLIRESQLPTLRVNGVSYTPDSDVHPVHRDGWYNHRLPDDYEVHYAEGLVLPDTQKMQFVGLLTPGGEWLAVAGYGINEYPGDSLPTVGQCLETAISVWQNYKEEQGL